MQACFDTTQAAQMDNVEPFNHVAGTMVANQFHTGQKQVMPRRHNYTASTGLVEQEHMAATLSCYTSCSGCSDYAAMM